LGLFFVPKSQARPQDTRTVKIVQAKLPVAPLKLTRERELGTMRLLSLNLAHGRKRSMHQYLLGKETFEKNLRDVADVIRREQPDVAAFQEADAPSGWSGNFHHVEYVAKFSNFPYSILGEHVQKMGLRYGTAFISLTPFEDPISHTFKPSFPMPGKGFVVATMTWPNIPSLKVDVVTLHLDPLRTGTQRSQLQEIIDVLRRRKHPPIIVGDFNNEWFKETSPLRSFASVLKLKAYQPFNPYLYTFPRFKKRFDWIFIPQDFSFSNYRVFKDALSDHYGILSDIKAPARYLPAPKATPTAPSTLPAPPSTQPAPSR
jgi:endonuclease/exonuclease/phosphatase family metal-dependent hydrolase